MRIETVFIPEKPELRGLKGINLTNLEQIVVFAGKNGSGKSRTLESIRDFLNISFNALDARGDGVQFQIDFGDDVDKFPGKIKPIRILEISSLQNYYSFNVTSDLNQIETFSDGLVEIRNVTLKTQIVTLNFSNSVTSIIQSVVNREHQATHPKYRGTEQEKQDAIEQFSLLNKLIAAVLGSEISYDSHVSFNLFNRRFKSEELSPGQRYLLSLAVAIFKEPLLFKELLIFMDEPENHLHPSAISFLLDQLLQFGPASQIFMATHSIPLLSAISEDCIWFVENGEIKKTGSETSHRVLLSLLGSDEDDRLRLQKFVNLPEIVALNIFASQCLIRSKPILTGPDDPQVQGISRIIGEKFIAKKGSIDLLDFGAGMCRILITLFDLHGGNSDLFRKVVNYFAFDIDVSDDNYGFAVSSIRSIYSDNNSRYFRAESELLQSPLRADLILICNTLHEISPNDWLKIFASGGVIDKCLQDDGYVLIVENHEMILGEKAHEFGFIVLNTSSLLKLFSSSIERVIIEYMKGERVKGHLIRKSDILQITSESIRSAIIDHRQRALEKISELQRTDAHSYLHGQLLGFYYSQLASCDLFLQDASL